MTVRRRVAVSAEGFGVPRFFALSAAISLGWALIYLTAGAWQPAAGMLAAAVCLAFIAYRMQAAVHRRRRMERQLARRGVRAPVNVRVVAPPAKVMDAYDRRHPGKRVVPPRDDWSVRVGAPSGRGAA